MTRSAFLRALTAVGLSGAAALPEPFTLSAAAQAAADAPWLRVRGRKGPGAGKKVVLVAADQEYRSEEVLPQLARLLAAHHGFDCTVLFCVDPATGTVNPNVNHIPGLEKLQDADLLILFCRWLDLPDAQLKPFLDYANSGRPLLGLRTSTHPFNLKASPTYRQWTWDSKEPGFEGGFGRVVLGETWVAHHGTHGKEGTRGIVAPGQEGHPILKGIAPGSIFGTTDVYTIRLPLPGDSLPLVLGEVTETLEPTSAPVPAKNAPMMPVAWTRTYTGTSGKPARVFMTTMGASQDFLYEGTRRMLVNGVYWALGMERKIAPRSNVALVGEYRPTPFRFKKSEDFKPGLKPSQY